MALLHISRVFVFFAMLSVATLGLQSFTERSAHQQISGSGISLSAFSTPFDWLASERADSRELFVLPAAILLLLAATTIWMGAWLPSLERPLRLHFEPQQASRPPPIRPFTN